MLFMYRYIRTFAIAKTLPLAALALLAACHADRSAPAASAGPAVTAETLQVTAAPAPVYSTVPGTVVSKRRAEIASRLTG